METALVSNFRSTSQQLLFYIPSANFQLTTDQVLTRVFSGTNYFLTNIVARQRTGAATVVCAGGIYDTVAKGGSAVVTAAQSWVTLASGVIVSASLAGLDATTLLANTLILSLTTGSTAAVTADVFCYGFDIS